MDEKVHSTTSFSFHKRFTRSFICWEKQESTKYLQYCRKKQLLELWAKKRSFLDIESTLVWIILELGLEERNRYTMVLKVSVSQPFSSRGTSRTKMKICRNVHFLENYLESFYCKQHRFWGTSKFPGIQDEKCCSK